MLSLKTCIELIYVVENYNIKVVDRLFVTFDIEHLIYPTFGELSKEKKVNILLKLLKNTKEKGPFTDSFGLDVLQFMLNHFYRYVDMPQNKNSMLYDDSLDHIEYDDKFSYKYPSLANCLKRDGYLIKARTIRKMLPNEIEEAKTENELFLLLDKLILIQQKDTYNKPLQIIHKEIGRVQTGNLDHLLNHF